MLKSVAIIGTLGALAACGGTSIPINEISSGAPVVSTMGGGGGGTPSTSNRDQSFATILNNMRIGNGSNAVRYDSRLDAAAQGHADDMVANGYFSHTSQNGDEVYDRIVAEGYNPIAYGENIAGGQQSEQDALDAWENSRPHNTMMNAGSLEEFGLGVAGSGGDVRWVLILATEG
jgi:uncharacterized protein YkwD